MLRKVRRFVLLQGTNCCDHSKLINVELILADLRPEQLCVELIRGYVPFEVIGLLADEFVGDRITDFSPYPDTWHQRRP